MRTIDGHWWPSSYFEVIVSFKGYLPGITLSSDNLPEGHQPPHLILFSSAKSRAARSTPDCPPLIIVMFLCITYYFYNQQSHAVTYKDSLLEAIDFYFR